MPESLIKYAFSSGELSPTLKGRSDLERYDLGLERGYNFFVDYRGGVSTRPGTEFVAYVKADDKPTKFVEFRFAPDVEDTYLLVFGDLYVRFIQDGAYVLESDIAMQFATQADPGEITANGHGLSNGDWVVLSGVTGMTELNGQTCIVANAAANSFEIQDPFGNNIDTSAYTAYISGGVVNRIYTVTTPYAAADLARLKVHQKQDQLMLTHTSYARRTLTRTAATSWTLALETSASPLAAPASITLTPSSAGTAGMAVTITAVDANGNESLPARYEFEETSVDYTTTAGSLKIEWDAVTGAKYYNVYRSLVRPTGADVTYADDVGYLGRAFGTQFIDVNIVPDFTKAPPQHYDPFADGAITQIDITAAGSGYSKSDTMSVSGGGGSGFVGYPVVNAGGEVIGAVIVNPGSGYSSPTVSFSGGTGATATATAGAASGNNPATSTIYEQRRVYGGTTNNPMTVFGSQPGDFDNFDTSVIPTAGDGYQHTLDDEEVAPIRHLIPMQDGLLVASKSGGWLLHGIDGQVVTALDAKADPVVYSGIDALTPLRIDTDVLFAQEGGASIRALVHNQFSRSSKPEDLSVMSNHLFANNKYLENWTWAEDPYKIVWGQRVDGALLSMTYVREQNVFAWMQHWTKGLFKDVKVVLEDNRYSVYLMVQRYVNGRYSKFVERMASRVLHSPEDAWCVDCGLALTLPEPAASLTLGAVSGAAVTFTASANVFSAGDVGKIIRAKNSFGRARVLTYDSATQVTVWIEETFANSVPEDPDNTPTVLAAGEWNMAAKVSTVSGLWHLEGQTVKVFADGNVQTDKTVLNGSITLSTPASRVVVGLGYTCIGKLLPLSTTGAVIEGKRKGIKGLAVRMYDSRGLSFGQSLDYMHEMPERSVEDWGDPTVLRDENRYILLDTDFEMDGDVYFKQTYPLPATLLGIVVDVDIGDGFNERD